MRILNNLFILNFENYHLLILQIKILSRLIQKY
jgi:hypothetical protein